MQTMIVIIICAAAAAWIVFRIVRIFAAKKTCDCEGCGVIDCAARREPGRVEKP